MNSINYSSLQFRLNKSSVVLKFSGLFLACIFSMFFVSIAAAQVNGSVTTTESICIADGSVKISSANASSIYALTGSSIPQMGPFSPAAGMVLFSLLPKGTYTITEYLADNTIKMQDVTVPGNYEQNWTWTAQVVYAPCGGGIPTVALKNFTIINSTLAQQRPPFTYRISAKNGSLPANGGGSPAFQSVSEFAIPYPAGVGGNYELQAKDACGNFKTINVYIPDNAPPPAVSSSFIKFINCAGDAEYRVDASGGAPPYQFEVRPGSTDQVGTIDNGITTRTYNLTHNGTYIIRVRDECGGFVDHTIYVPAYGNPTLSLGGGFGKCGTTPGSPGTGMFGISTGQYGIGPYTVEITSDCGYSNTFTNVSSYFEVYDLPRPCNYTVKVTDGCGFMTTLTQNLTGPGIGSLNCGNSVACPDANSTLIKIQIYLGYGPPYNPTLPFTYDLRNSSNVSMPGFPKVVNDYQIFEPVPAGDYTYTVTDACGGSCAGGRTILAYADPTVTVDVNSRCFGAGQALVVGVNGNPYNTNITNSNYQISAGPDHLYFYGESDGPAGKGQFSNLQSEGNYTFQFNDGCKNAYVSTTVPKYAQPTWEVGFGLICPPNPKANLQIINIEPAGQIIGPYYWQITGHNSDDPSAPAVPFPNSVGQQDSIFLNLPPKLDQSVATYTILGYDGCKNSFQGQGKVGPFPDEEIIIDKTLFCPDANSSLKIRVSNPIVGGRYDVYRDGIKVASSTNLFTYVSPAIAGNYYVKIIAGTAPDTCTKETNTVLVATTGSVTAVPGPCIPATSTYTLEGEVSLATIPTSGTLTVQIAGGGNQILNAPFTSPITYSIPNQNSDGATHAVTATFSEDNSCMPGISYKAPLACMPSCVLSGVGLANITCANNGTVTDPADDTYTFTLNPTGTELGTSYIVSGLPNSPQTGVYGAPTTFGPYLISAGALSIMVADNVVPTCKLSATVTPPAPCSVCDVAPPLVTVVNNVCPQRIGSINLVQNCGPGSSVQYSSNNGVSWTSVKPFYTQTAKTILARCLFTSDTACKSSIVSVTTAPVRCLNPGQECAIVASAVLDPCNDNGTNDDASDDYFTIQVNATVQQGGASTKYEVVIGADPLTGTGGNVLNSGGTTYGSPALIGTSKIFKADGTSTYELVVRDIDNKNCFQNIMIDKVASCATEPQKSPCYPVPCVPIGMIKN